MMKFELLNASQGAEISTPKKQKISRHISNSSISDWRVNLIENDSFLKLKEEIHVSQSDEYFHNTTFFKNFVENLEKIELRRNKYQSLADLELS